MEKLAHWAKHGPYNYAHRHSLLCAEVARVEGRVVDAIGHYEAAIRGARSSGAVQFEALANELASAFHAAHRFDTVAATHARQARACYRRWGALAKVRELEAKFPQWLGPELPNGDSSAGGTTLQSLDLATVLKVSRAVSGERLLTTLIETLMTLAVEHAGAQRAVLILTDGQSLSVEAEAMTSGTRIDVHTGQGSPSSSRLPMSVLNYVVRTRSHVVIDDASIPGEHSVDEYIRRERSRSILCLPLLNQDRLVGVLYVENPLASHVFTGARTAVLTLLASQAAISIENARLYGQLLTAHEYMGQAERLSHTGSLSWKPATGELFWSEEVHRIFDADPGDAPSVELARGRVHPDDAPFVERAIASALHDGTTTTLDFRLRSPSGAVKYVSLLGHRRSDVVDGAREYVGAIRDITERRVADAALQEARAALTHVTRVATLGEMTAAITHEVSQPIAASSMNLLASLRWLRATPPNIDAAIASATRANRDTMRAGEVLQRLRALFKKSSDTREPFDIHRAIGEAIDLTEAETRKHGVTVTTAFEGDAASVLGDRVQLQQVIVNLVLNAAEALSTVTQPTREVHVRTKQEGGRLAIEVEDNGPGIPPPEAEKVFSAFHTTKPKGMGMGLAVSRTIVESHEGSLVVTPNNGPGATFHFSIPLAQTRSSS